MNKVRFGTACVALALVFGATGCSAADDSSESSPTNETTAPSNSGSDMNSGDSKGSVLDAFAAVDQAETLVDGVVVELGRGSEGGVAVWEAGMLLDDGSGTELYIDMSTGDEVKRSSLNLSSEQRTAPQVNAKSGMESALGAMPGEVAELDLGTERSRVVWEVAVEADAGGEFEVYVDAATAEILKQERSD